MLCRHIRHNIPVQIRKDNHLNSLVKFRIQHFSTHGVHQTLLNLDFRILLSYFSHSLDKIAIRQFDNVGLGDNGNIFLSVFPGIIKGCPGNPLTSLLRLHLKVHGQILIDLNALISPDIFALNIFPKKRPVNIFVRNLDGTDSCK